MLHYVDTMVTFSEVPDEISLCINISGCPCHCEGCHSSYLADEVGRPLNWDNLNALIFINTGITCVAFMGGDKEPKMVNRLAEKLKDHNLKTAWYSGRQELSPDINLQNFDFIKLGPYKQDLGPLNSKTTNQRMYKVVKTNYEDGTSGYELEDITYKFWKS